MSHISHLLTLKVPWFGHHRIFWVTMSVERIFAQVLLSSEERWEDRSSGRIAVWDDDKETEWMCDFIFRWIDRVNLVVIHVAGRMTRTRNKVYPLISDICMRGVQTKFFCQNISLQGCQKCPIWLFSSKNNGGEWRDWVVLRTIKKIIIKRKFWQGIRWGRRKIVFDMSWPKNLFWKISITLQEKSIQHLIRCIHCNFPTQDYFSSGSPQEFIHISNSTS